MSDNLDPVTLEVIRNAFPAIAKELGCDLIALGYRGRSRVRDIFLGRTTEWMIGQVPIAILVAR